MKRHATSTIIAGVILAGSLYFLVWVFISKSKVEHEVELALRPLLSMPQLQIKPQEIKDIKILEGPKIEIGPLTAVVQEDVVLTQEQSVISVSGPLFSIFIPVDLPGEDFLDGEFNSYRESLVDVHAPVKQFQQAKGLSEKQKLAKKIGQKFELAANAKNIFCGSSRKCGVIVSEGKTDGLEILWWPDTTKQHFLVLSGKIKEQLGIQKLFEFLSNSSFKMPN